MNRSYLKKNRLEDILFLIQYLGAHNSFKKETNPDRVKSRSGMGNGWLNIACEHPEFFYVTEGDKSIKLRMREIEGKHVFSPERVESLMKMAMAIHERQTRGTEVWKMWVAMIAAIIAATVSIAELFFKTT